MSKGNVPVNTQQIHSLISNTNEKDMIFYEYEIVNRDKEKRWGKRQARKYGLCLCSRWLFLLVGNAILVALICAISAIILYVNTPNDITIQPLGYNVYCSTGTSNCDSLRNLVCKSNVCSCYSNYVWNGTDCACTSNMYWDGLACIQFQGYQQTCAPWLPCSQTPTAFTCDERTGTCLCSSLSTHYYTQYYTGSVTDYYGNYGGQCLSKQGVGSACSSYGVISCQEWLNLTCSFGPINNYLNCYCYSGYYWDDLGTGSGSIGCLPMGQVVGYVCEGTYKNYACNTNASLTCNSVTSQCQCGTNYFYHTGTGACTIKRGYQGYCQSDTWCNGTATGAGLTCYLSTTSTTTPACNCPNTSLLNTCDCGKNKWWDGQICTNTVNLNQPCPGQYACNASAALTCLYGYCLQ